MDVPIWIERQRTYVFKFWFKMICNFWYHERVTKSQGRFFGIINKITKCNSIRPNYSFYRYRIQTLRNTELLSKSATFLPLGMSKFPRIDWLVNTWISFQITNFTIERTGSMGSTWMRWGDEKEWTKFNRFNFNRVHIGTGTHNFRMFDRKFTIVRDDL